MSNKPNLMNIRGVTLIELMLSLLISSVVLAALFLASKGIQSTSNDMQKDMRTQLAIRSFIEMLSTHASQSGYQPPDSVADAIVNASDPFPMELNGANNLKFVFDTNSSTRHYAIYSLLSNVVNGRSEFKIVLRRYKVSYPGKVATEIFTAEDVLRGVKSFSCSSRTSAAMPRALDCVLKVYKDFSLNSPIIEYEFSLSTVQTF